MLEEKKKGRPKGIPNKFDKYRWYVEDVDVENPKFGRFSTISALNRAWGLNLTHEKVFRIMTHIRVDESGRYEKNSFMSRYGTLRITKLN